MLPYFLFGSLFPVQQTMSGIGHRLEYFFRVGNQYAECEKQQQLPYSSFEIVSKHGDFLELRVDYNTWIIPSNPF